MKKTSFLVALGLFAAVGSAQAQLFGLSIGHRGVSVSVGGPVCAAPPVYYSQPVYAPAPQVYYSQPPVVYAAPPVCAAPVYAPGYYSYGPAVVIRGGYGGWYRGYGGYRGHWDHRGWHR